MSEQHVIEKLRHGGQKELGEIYEQHRMEFLHWISKEFGLSMDDCKDIYQVAIMIFYDNVRSGKLEHLVSSVKTYLFAVGKNVARENMRKAKRTTTINQQEWLKEYLVDEPDQPVAEQLFATAKVALQKLGQPCQKLVELFYYERKTMEEISLILNYKNAETAKNQKCKCMARLRKLYEDESLLMTSTSVSHE